LPEAATPEAAAAPAPAYRRILAPLDHTELDRLTLTHAAAIARLHHAKVYLLHVEEGVTSQVYGREASTAEVEAGAAYLDRIARSFREQGIAVETAIIHSSSPKRAIVKYAQEIQPDLVVMGAHGHGGLKDLVLGNTINPVRHDLNVPMLIVRPGKKR
jgi:manganese transport protein